MYKFKNLIILSPLVYIFHHFEEFFIFNFREWRLQYLPDNNAISPEEILMRLIGVFLIIIYVHSITKNRPSALVALYFVMTTQVVNAFFHVSFSIIFWDFSPGTITGILLYLPLNYLIASAALREGYVKNKIELIILFLLGLGTFALFEIYGPIVMRMSFFAAVIYYLYSVYNESKVKV